MRLIRSLFVVVGLEDGVGIGFVEASVEVVADFEGATGEGVAGF